MKYRKCTEEETNAIVEMIEAAEVKSEMVEAIGYDIMKQMFAEYVKNFKPSLFRWKPLPENKFYYQLTQFSGTPQLTQKKKRKYVSRRVFIGPHEIPGLNKKWNLSLNEQMVFALNFASSVGYDAREFERWKSRVILWGEKPYEFTTDSDLTFYEELKHNDERFNHIIAQYPNVQVYANEDANTNG